MFGKLLLALSKRAIPLLAKTIQPVIGQTLGLVLAAEREFPGHNYGRLKLEWVVDRLSRNITLPVWLQPRASQIWTLVVNIIVEVLNARSAWEQKRRSQ